MQKPIKQLELDENWIIPIQCNPSEKPTDKAELIAKKETAKIILVYMDGTSKNIFFKEGTKIQTTVNHEGAILKYDPNMEIKS